MTEKRRRRNSSKLSKTLYFSRSRPQPMTHVGQTPSFHLSTNSGRSLPRHLSIAPLRTSSSAYRSGRFWGGARVRCSGMLRRSESNEAVTEWSREIEGTERRRLARALWVKVYFALWLHVAHSLFAFLQPNLHQPFLLPLLPRPRPLPDYTISFLRLSLPTPQVTIYPWQYCWKEQEGVGSERWWQESREDSVFIFSKWVFSQFQLDLTGGTDEIVYPDWCVWPSRRYGCKDWRSIAGSRRRQSTCLCSLCLDLAEYGSFGEEESSSRDWTR